MYRHTQMTDAGISLHDRTVSGLSWEEGKLSLLFSEGFLFQAAPEKEYAPTGPARVEHFLRALGRGDITVHIFTLKHSGKAIREEWEISRLCDYVNKGTGRLEYLYTFRSGWTWILRCSLFAERRPYTRECEIELPVEQSIYCWDDPAGE